MKKTTLILTLLAGLFIVAGCDLHNDSEYREQFVLDGTLYVDHPLSVRLTTTTSIYQYYDNAQQGVSGALVRIWADGQEYILREDTARPGTYSLPADSHVVATGSDYEIRIEISDHVISAVSESAPAQLTVDSTDLSVWRDSTRMDTVEFDRILFYMRWNADPGNDGYALVVENLEPDWFEDYRELSGNANAGYRANLLMWAQRFITDMQLPPIVLTCTGRHRIRVFSCNRTAYDFFATSFPGEPKYQPESNVEGALGVFCAVGVDTVYFYLKDDIEQ